jgi:peptidoglycan/xylan/chitin deacetylase (PgdA/CDA1 family)
VSKKKTLTDRQIEDMGLRVFVIKQHVKDILTMSDNNVPVNSYLYRDIQAIERKTQTLYRSLELEATARGWSEDHLSKIFAKRLG